MKKVKCYEFSELGVKKAKMDMKSDKIGNVMQVIVIGVIIVLLIQGVVGQKFIVNYTVGNVTSKTVKYFMR